MILCWLLALPILMYILAMIMDGYQDRKARAEKLSPREVEIVRHITGLEGAKLWLPLMK
jgi:hypothetical protein